MRGEYVERIDLSEVSITWSMVDPGERESLVWALVSGMEPGTRLMRWVAVCRSALATEIY